MVMGRGGTRLRRILTVNRNERFAVVRLGLSGGDAHGLPVKATESKAAGSNPAHHHNLVRPVPLNRAVRGTHDAEAPGSGGGMHDKQGWGSGEI